MSTASAQQGHHLHQRQQLKHLLLKALEEFSLQLQQAGMAKLMNRVCFWGLARAVRITTEMRRMFFWLVSSDLELLVQLLQLFSHSATQLYLALQPHSCCSYLAMQPVKLYLAIQLHLHQWHFSGDSA